MRQNRFRRAMASVTATPMATNSFSLRNCSALLISGRSGTLSLMIRVAIIGAGSVEFTRKVVADLCSFPEFAGQVTIALHDIDRERLAYSERAATSLVRRTGAGFRVE